MLEHQKLLLKNLYDQPQRFKNELIKSAKWLNNTELDELAKWLDKEFGRKEKQLLLKLMHPVSVLEAV